MRILTGNTLNKLREQLCEPAGDVLQRPESRPPESRPEIRAEHEMFCIKFCNLIQIGEDSDQIYRVVVPSQGIILGACSTTHNNN